MTLSLQLGALGLAWQQQLIETYWLSLSTVTLLFLTLGSHFLPQGAGQSYLLLPLGASFLLQPAGGSTHFRGPAHCFFGDQVCSVKNCTFDNNNLKEYCFSRILAICVGMLYRLISERDEELTVDTLSKDLKTLAKQTKATKFREVMKLLRLVLSGLQVPQHTSV